MPESYSSEHMHQYKNNFFYCIKGMMLIKVWKQDRAGNIDVTVLMPGMVTEVKAGEYHQFETPKLGVLKTHFPDWDAQEDRVEVLEVYVQPNINLNDIVRKTTGGSSYTIDGVE